MKTPVQMLKQYVANTTRRNKRAIRRSASLAHGLRFATRTAF